MLLVGKNHILITEWAPNTVVIEWNELYYTNNLWASMALCLINLIRFKVHWSRLPHLSKLLVLCPVQERPPRVSVCRNDHWHWWVRTSGSIPGPLWVLPWWQQHHLCWSPWRSPHQGWWIRREGKLPANHSLRCNNGNDGGTHQSIHILWTEAWLRLQTLQALEHTCWWQWQLLTLRLLGFKAEQDDGLLGRIFARIKKVWMWIARSLLWPGQVV